ncbi:URE2 [Trichoderma gamsii]|uniref:URE2 n=1 Tax=Trichoderma gamsii TaxID=398673 RepID=A0A2P4ZCB8_9HYPO|nr:URE2 [Trichoderma gamsii]PON21930.1 URE2 [Trichoderma gamsii]
MALQPIELWGHWGAPNPWKVCIILEELKLPYVIHQLEFSQVKEEHYVKLNPNGRLPTIKDPNTGITLWESGAIILYLVEQYDNDGKISSKSAPEKHLAQQWLAFQISGQGPYFGQATWFARFHAEKLQSAVDRYVGEILRVTEVLDRALERNGTGWLVGNSLTYADLSFITWASVGKGLLKELGRDSEIDKYTAYAAWIQAMEKKDSVKKIQDNMAKGRAAHGL